MVSDAGSLVIINNRQVDTTWVESSHHSLMGAYGIVDKILPIYARPLVLCFLINLK